MRRILGRLSLSESTRGGSSRATSSKSDGLPIHGGDFCASEQIPVSNGRQSYHFNFKFSYFFNDDRAHSIRIDPGADEIRGQVDATVLVEHRASRKLRFNFETGFLGLNAVVPSGHLGLSTSWMSEFWLVQFGASMTWRLPNTGPRMFEYLGASDTGFHTAKDGQTIDPSS